MKIKIKTIKARPAVKKKVIKLKPIKCAKKAKIAYKKKRRAGTDSTGPKRYVRIPIEP